MEKTAINSIYLLCHIIEDTQEDLERAIESEKTENVWEAYFREDEAQKEANHLNNLFTNNCKMYERKHYHRFVVIETRIF